MTTEDILNNAIELIKASQRAEAQKLLEPYIETHLQNVRNCQVMPKPTGSM